MPRLSIVIPALGNAEQLEESLVSVLENRPDRCELLVVLNYPYHDPYNLEDEVRFVQAPRGAGLTEMVNAGFAASEAPIVHLLACGARVSEGWADLALEHFNDSSVAAVAPLVLDRWHADRVVSAGIDYHAGGARRFRTSTNGHSSGRPVGTVLGPSALAGFYRTSSLAAVGEAFDGSVGDYLADVDLALRLHEAGYRAELEPASKVYHASASPAPRGAFRRARQAERLFWRHAMAAGWHRSLPLHALIVAAELARSFPRPRLLAQLAGRLLASCEWGYYWRQSVRQAAARAATAGNVARSTSSRRLDPQHPPKRISAQAALEIRAAE